MQPDDMVSRLQAEREEALKIAAQRNDTMKPDGLVIALGLSFIIWAVFGFIAWRAWHG